MPKQPEIWHGKQPSQNHAVAQIL